MSRAYRWALLGAISLGGCAATPTPQAAAVAEADQARVATCELLETVLGKSLIGGSVFTTGGTNAMVEARERAAAMGATHIVFGSVDSGSMYSTGSATARAYRCAS
jgi:hypothetical protein